MLEVFGRILLRSSARHTYNVSGDAAVFRFFHGVMTFFQSSLKFQIALIFCFVFLISREV